MTTQTHYFIAIPIDKVVKQKLSEWNTKELPPFQRFVHEDDLHITLAFLGGLELPVLDALKDKLLKITRNLDPFSLTIDTLGHFGQKQSPRIFWASVKQENKLFQLQNEVYQTCIDVGIELEKRAYSPHITLARKYIGEGTYVEEHLQESFQKYLKNESWTVSSFVIYQTHLKRIPKYEVVATFQFL
ncbi:MAG: RNA 2',3'-cyclic phosphodiesterase [Anaerobacillus sp.]|uniref:RNA 2',3'-cyclic phosphodiesterase n=1 Tax=Anaerobacillus sp. TaxID=1872506 RepID=UPI00391AFD3F